MTTLVLVFLLVLPAGTTFQDQIGGLAGTWEVEQVPGRITLEVTGTEVQGRVLVGNLAAEIFDGRVDGLAVSFKVRSLDGDRIVTFMGQFDGDIIRFSRTVEIVEGGSQGGVGLLAAGGPTDLVARRENGETWSGTVRNAPTQRNPNPNPNLRTVTLATRQVPDPHWRWRGGPKELTVRTFNLPNQSFPLNAFTLEDDQLSYSYSRPAGDEISCALVRQPEGAFAGRCQSNVGGFSVLIQLKPPGGDGGRSRND